MATEAVANQAQLAYIKTLIRQAKGWSIGIDDRAKEILIYQAELRSVVETYNKKRMDWIKAELANRYETWCMKCLTVFPNSEQVIFLKKQWVTTHSLGIHGAVGKFREDLVRRCVSCASRVEEENNGHLVTLEKVYVIPNPNDIHGQDQYFLGRELLSEFVARNLYQDPPEALATRLGNEYNLPLLGIKYNDESLGVTQLTVGEEHQQTFIPQNQPTLLQEIVSGFDESSDFSMGIDTGF